MRHKWFGVVTAALLIGATPGFGQLPGLELEPFVGAYVPTQDVVDQDILGEQFQGSQKEGFLIGGRLTAWLAGPLGVEGSFQYALSDAEVTEGTTTFDEDAGVWMGSGRVILKLLPGPVGIHVNGGVALIGRTGDAYDDVTEGKTDLGGVAGVGLRVKLPGVFGIRGDLEGYAYQTELTIDTGGGSTVTTDGEWQVDVVASVGLIIGLL